MPHPRTVLSLLVLGLTTPWLAARQAAPTPPAAAAAAPAPEPDYAEGSPEWLVQRFFKAKEFPDVQRYYSRQMQLNMGKQPHPGARYADPGFTVTQREFYRDERMVAIAVNVAHKEPKNRGDFYAFVRRDGDRWGFDAIRQNTVPVSAMRAMGVLSQTNIKPGSRDGWEMQALTAFVLTDEQAKARFKEKRADFEKLRDALLRSNYTAVIHGARRTGRVPADLWQRVRDLQFYYVEVDARGRVELNLARAGESGVGFYWVPEGGLPPAPSVEGYILMDPLGDGWFLYRKA